jgi:hypothetical protein
VKATLVCGPEETDMMAVLDVIGWLHKCYRLRLLDRLRIATTHALYLWKTSYDIAQNNFSGLIAALINCRHLSTTDPKDKVFGVFGLLNQSVVGDLISPDYTKPISSVLRDAVRQSFAEDWLLLGDVSHHDNFDLLESDFPSWVPRVDRPWDSELGAIPLAMPGVSRDFKDLEEYKYQENAASLKDPDVLILKALELCDVLRFPRRSTT